MAANTPTSSVIKPPATRAHQFPHKHKVYNLLHANCAPKSTPILQKGQTCHGINVKLARLHVRKATSKLARNGRVIGPVAALPGALLFDCDGVLVDTERDGHRISFNEAFSEKGLNVTWDVDLYGELLKIGGGKERMTAYFNKTGWPDIAPKTEGERKEFIASLHRRKTELFMALIEKRLLPLRPGVARLIDEALEKGVKVAICSTSNEKAVSAIVQCLLGPPRADAISIFAGDVVPRKKPDPVTDSKGDWNSAASCLPFGTFTRLMQFVARTPRPSARRIKQGLEFLHLSNSKFPLWFWWLVLHLSCKDKRKCCRKIKYLGHPRPLGATSFFLFIFQNL